MLKNPFEVLREYSKDKLERDRKTNEFIYSQTDSLITWLIGFAVTGLLLIVSNFVSLKTNLGSTAKPIIFCLSLTIILGIAFRYVSYLMILFQKSLDDYFGGIYSDLEMTPIEVEDDIETADYNYIIKRLKDDFNEIIPFPRPLSELEQQVELPKLKDHYKALCAHSKKQFDIAVNHLAEINETAYKIKKETTLNIFYKNLQNPKIGFNLVKWQKVRG